jgi:hypothetical protein
MDKFIQGCERFFIGLENFFNKLTFLPRLLSAAGKAATAFNDEFFREDRKRQREIAERKAKEEKEKQQTNETTNS